MTATILPAFVGLENAKTSEQGSYLEPGLYALEITNCLVKTLRKGGEAFIVECKVLESTSAKFPVGSKASWFQGFKEREVAHGAIKLFVYAVLGVDAKADKETIARDIDPKISALTSEAVTNNAMKGEKVRCQVSIKKTKAGGDFSLHEFSPYAA